MNRTHLGTLALAATLSVGGLTLSASAATTTPPPPTPGEWRASSTDGCWKSTLNSRVERRFVTISGHRFAEFRTVTTVLRWCPETRYVIVIWKSPWGPGRR